MTGLIQMEFSPKSINLLTGNYYRNHLSRPRQVKVILEFKLEEELRHRKWLDSHRTTVMFEETVYKSGQPISNVNPSVLPDYLSNYYSEQAKAQQITNKEK
jgi:hypothetical protein